MITKRIYTSCSEAYDYSQAKTVDPNVGTTTNGRIIRLVEITEDECRVDYQIGRYQSSITDLVVSPEDFKKLVECSAVKERKLCPVCGDRVLIDGKTRDGRLIGSCGDAFTREQWEE